MRWGGDEVGVVLTRNEVWLLLHALGVAQLPAVDWEGNAVEPWVVGELRNRLQGALRPDPLSDVEERPLIRIDSDMGRSLAMAEVRPLVMEGGYDLGSLFAACAERGWGAELVLPPGGGPETPATARIIVKRGDGEIASRAEEFVGLERPVVAFARALVGAAFSEGGEAERRRGGEEALRAEDRLLGVDEHVIFSDAVAPGEREGAIEQMKERGWELVRDEGDKLLFRRHGG